MARPETLVITHFDSVIAVYHRSSGITHFLAAPAPQILAALGECGLTRSGLLARLRAGHALEDPDSTLTARLHELVACGLVMRDGAS